MGCLNAKQNTYIYIYIYIYMYIYIKRYYLCFAKTSFFKKGLRLAKITITNSVWFLIFAYEYVSQPKRWICTLPKDEYVPFEKNLTLMCYRISWRTLLRFWIQSFCSSRPVAIQKLKSPTALSFNQWIHAFSMSISMKWNAYRIIIIAEIDLIRVFAFLIYMWIYTHEYMCIYTCA